MAHPRTPWCSASANPASRSPATSWTPAWPAWTATRRTTRRTPGFPALSEAFAARFREEQGVDIGADRVYVVSGAQQGLHFAMSLLLSPGDEKS